MSDKVALRYPKAIYREEVVRHAISDYRHICKIDLAKDDSAIVCTLYDSAVDVCLAGREFSNYLIELMNHGNSNGDL